MAILFFCPSAIITSISRCNDHGDCRGSFLEIKKIAPESDREVYDAGARVSVDVALVQIILSGFSLVRCAWPLA